MLCCELSGADVDTWCDLLMHMESSGHHRALIDTLMILRHHRGDHIDINNKPKLCLARSSYAVSIDYLCSSDITSSLIRVINIFTLECADKIQQVCFNIFLFLK